MKESWPKNLSLPGYLLNNTLRSICILILLIHLTIQNFLTGMLMLECREYDISKKIFLNLENDALGLLQFQGTE